MEYETLKNPHFPNGISEAAAHCDGCDEESICNCENNERVTPYFSDEQWTHDASATSAAEEPAGNRCKKIKSRCKKTVNRLKKDWKTCRGKPYIKQKTSCRFEIYQSKNDQKPIDSFEAETVKSYALRTVALWGAGIFVTACAVKCLFKK